MKLYHIDRSGTLKTGNTIDLMKFNDIIWDVKERETILQDIVDDMYPEGVTRHGERYFLMKPVVNDTSFDVEMLFELVRLDKYKVKQSRFQSFFAVDKDYFGAMFDKLQPDLNTAKIFEVEADEVSKHDMNLLSKSSNLASVAFARLYWEGKSLDNPLYEYLLKPPVKIIKEVTIEELLKSE